MIILLESIFVGFYSLLISFIIFNFCNYSIMFNVFVIGFLKHFISKIIGLQKYYCNKYIKCHNFSGNNLNIILESIGEGILFLLFYFILSKFIIKHDYLIIFLSGVILHILFEKLGFHSLFCSIHCKPDF